MDIAHLHFLIAECEDTQRRALVEMLGQLVFKVRNRPVMAFAAFLAFSIAASTCCDRLGVGDRASCADVPAAV